MIETASATTALDTQASSDLEITGITFEGGDLSRPRYPSLIDYSRAPVEVQFEPGLQIISLDPIQLTVVYQIDPAAEVVFARDAAGLPVVQSVAAAPDTGPVPGLSAELLDPTTCRLTWNQAAAVSASTALRILCEPSGRLATGPEQVDGGVYLAIVHRHEEGSESIQGTAPGLPEDRTIKILGTDSQGRPRYDLFFPGVLANPDLELEISFRVRKGEEARFDLLFSVVPGSDVRFETVAGQVVVQPARPAELKSTAASDLKEKCSLVWVEGAGQTTQGKVSSFFLVASEAENPIEIRATRKLRRAQFDPTVIQPPSCTSGGICI
jgi:hypothetical protein